MSLDTQKQVEEALEGKRIIAITYDPDWCGAGYLELVLDDATKVVIEGDEGGFDICQHWEKPQ